MCRLVDVYIILTLYL